MKTGEYILGIVVLVIFAFSPNKTFVHAKERGMPTEIHESPYVTPFPLAHGGERVDVVIRVTKADYHHFNLVFVERRDWSEEKKYELRRVFKGWALLGEFNNQRTYPIKLRFQLDSIDGKTNVHIDEIIADRGNGGYLTFSGSKDTDWRANNIYFPRLEKGIYRVRVENLSPCPDIAWIETLFEFLRIGRKF